MYYVCLAARDAFGIQTSIYQCILQSIREQHINCICGSKLCAKRVNRTVANGILWPFPSAIMPSVVSKHATTIVVVVEAGCALWLNNSCKRSEKPRELHLAKSVCAMKPSASWRVECVASSLVLSLYFIDCRPSASCGLSTQFSGAFACIQTINFLNLCSIY